MYIIVQQFFCLVLFVGRNGQSDPAAELLRPSCIILMNTNAMENIKVARYYRVVLTILYDGRDNGLRNKRNVSKTKRERFEEQDVWCVRRQWTGELATVWRDLFCGRDRRPSAPPPELVVVVVFPLFGSKSKRAVACKASLGETARGGARGDVKIKPIKLELLEDDRRACVAAVAATCIAFKLHSTASSFRHELGVQ